MTTIATAHPVEPSANPSAISLTVSSATATAPPSSAGAASFAGTETGLLSKDKDKDKDKDRERERETNIKHDHNKAGDGQYSPSPIPLSPSPQPLSQEEHLHHHQQPPEPYPRVINHIFPPLPTDDFSGQTKLRWVAGWLLSFVLGSVFLAVILIPAFVLELSRALHRAVVRLCTCHDPRSDREFWEQERAMQIDRKRRRREWRLRKREVQKKNKNNQQQKQQQQKQDIDTATNTDPGVGMAGAGAISSDADPNAHSPAHCSDSDPEIALEYEPTEGGHDKLLRDVGYYARRVGLDARKHSVQTEDGFILDLWRLFDPKEERIRARHGAADTSSSSPPPPLPRRRYPILLISGLFQHVGAYCVNDDSSIAFYLFKTGYDVWLGGNRCGFTPQHAHLRPSNPAFWSWTVQHMGVYDLPAHVSFVRRATGFGKIALVGHSQGTTQTLIALSHGQRPDLAGQLSVFCALAPAVFAGPTLDTLPFRFFKSLSRRAFSVLFGTHTFLPAMLHAYDYLPSRRLYGSLAYLIFAYLFKWTDARWDRGLKARMFGFAPILVSTEHMWWWVSKDGFSGRGCVFDMPADDPGCGAGAATGAGAAHASHQQRHADAEAAGAAVVTTMEASAGPSSDSESATPDTYEDKHHHHHHHHHHHQQQQQQQPPTSPPQPQPIHKGHNHWFPPSTPPLALWVPESDNLVDGVRFLRHVSDKAREPHARVVHASVIPGYEHLDVLWAVDSVDKVSRDVANVIWDTAVCGNEEDNGGGEGDVVPLADQLMVPRSVTERERGRAQGSTPSSPSLHSLSASSPGGMTQQQQQ